MAITTRLPRLRALPAAAGEQIMTGRTFKPNETVDFVVVGSGAAGGVMARELSRGRVRGARARTGATLHGRGLQARRTRLTGSTLD